MRSPLKLLQVYNITIHMEAMAWFIITALLLLLLCLIILRLRSSQSIHLPPGPLYLPIINDDGECVVC